MPTKNKYSHYKLNKQGRKSTVVATFSGADFSSQRFNVSTSRAINIQNFIYKDGVIQKRHGYEQIYKVEPVAYFDKFTSQYNVNGVNFNGMWKFRAEDDQIHIVAHIGNLLFEIKEIDNDSISIDYLRNAEDSDSYSGLDNNGNAVSKPLLYKYEDYKSFAFVGGKRLWFLGGNKYMVIRFTNTGLKVYPVENSEEAFVPTTTTGITYAYSKSPSRVSYDYPNKLTYFRINKLISGTGKESGKTETQYYEYTLDSPLVWNPNLTITNNTNADIDKIRVVIKTRRKTEGN